MLRKPAKYVVDASDGTKVLVTVDCTGAGAWVSVSPYREKTLGPSYAKVVWVPDVRAGLAELIP